LSADSELTELLASYARLVEGMRRATTLSARLLQSAISVPLMPEQAHQARREIETTHDAIEEIDATLTLRRQCLRPM
jgi:hypothetical protein